MEVKDIDKYFSFDVLRRGYDYYKNGKVKNIIKLKDGFIAKVNGSEEYKVTIVINKDNYKMECTCPYAEENNCKHMAAVLYCLKNNELPVKEKNINAKSDEITSFDKFKKSFKSECYKLFHNRYYLHENELEDYADIVNTFIKEGVKYIDNDILLAYEIFEFFLMEIDGIDVYDEYGMKEELFANLFESFKKIFNDEKIFVKFLAFIGTIYTLKSDEYYFHHKENLLNLLYQYLEYDWQAQDTLVLLNKLNNDKRIYDYQKTNIITKIIYINYYFIDKEKANFLATLYLDIDEICDFLLKITNDEIERIEVLEKIVNSSKNYPSEKYYDMLLDIYKETDNEKYLDLLKKYFQKYCDMKIYNMIKEYYSAREWLKVRKYYLEMARNSRLYYDICVEEGYYDELVEALKKGKWTDQINSYIDILKRHRPNELLEIYKEAILHDISIANDRKNYQKKIANFHNFKRIPNGEKELKDIIKYIRENYKNRKALQEELDFYEETYM